MLSLALGALMGVLAAIAVIAIAVTVGLILLKAHEDGQDSQDRRH